MRYHEINIQGKAVPTIGQGCGKLDLDVPLDVIESGLDMGMCLLDTAEAYNDGRSEKALSFILKKRRNDVLIASKVSPEHLNHKKLIESCESSLTRLGIDEIDLYQIHWSNSQIPVQETMGAVSRLIEQGKVVAAGVCNFSLEEIKVAEKEFLPNHIIAVQSEYNLFDRSSELDIIPYCQQTGKIFIGYSPLEQGTITGGIRSKDIMMAVAEKYNATIAQIALAWLTTLHSVTVIPKAASSKHISENAQASDIILEDGDYDLISNAFPREPIWINTNTIRVVQDGVDNRTAYRSIEEAIENRLGMTPSPLELADELREKKLLKPVRLRKAVEPANGYSWDLIEGRLRYWAWVIANDGKKKIPALIRQ